MISVGIKTVFGKLSYSLSGIHRIEYARLFLGSYSTLAILRLAYSLMGPACRLPYEGVRLSPFSKWKEKFLFVVID